MKKSNEERSGFMYVWENKIDDVTFITLNNQTGMKIVLSTNGASIYDLKVIDKNNNLESVVLYPTNLEDFYTSTGYQGKCIGRFSGRIDKGVCEIAGKKYQLDINWNGISALHGGFNGIAFQNFLYQIVEDSEKVEVIFTYLEKEEILPGDVNYQITYQVFKNKNEINLLFDAETNKETIVNLTNHVYFNLSGDGKRTVMNQKMQLLCDKYTKLNQELITEKIEEVNEVMDFRRLHEIGDYINDDSLQNHTAKGYDHCWLKTDPEKAEVAVMQDDLSGRRLKVSSSYPAVVCYAGCYPLSFPFNKDGIKISKHHSMCLECQYVPNGINMDNVCKAILKPGEKYHHYIKYQFDLI